MRGLRVASLCTPPADYCSLKYRGIAASRSGADRRDGLPMFRFSWAAFYPRPGENDDSRRTAKCRRRALLQRIGGFASSE